jgi:hypothetical protein
MLMKSLISIEQLRAATGRLGLIDENGVGPGVRLRKRQRTKVVKT